MNYESIKLLAKQLDVSVNDLIALAPGNDPFYCGAPAQLEKAQWFADVWNGFNISTPVHLRRLHYRIISQETPLFLPNGLPYENTEGCWALLQIASKYARYNNLVPLELFRDARSPVPIVNRLNRDYVPSITVRMDFGIGEASLPDFPRLPRYDVDGIGANQRYHIEIWCEKSTMDDILVPLCSQYSANLVVGIGEMTSMSLKELVAGRLHKDYPTRIFYISDFDPAGQSMPTSASRKCEFYIESFSFEGNVKFYPIMLTADQVAKYNLPRTPIKDTERRAGKFEERHGEGAVELDALEALHPGEFRRIVRGEIQRYYDDQLWEKSHDARSKLDSTMYDLRAEVLADHELTIDSLQAEYEEIQTQFRNVMKGFNERLQNEWQAIQTELEEKIPFLDDFEQPEAAEAKERPGALFDSDRPYLEQMQHYKQFQGKS